MFDRCIYFNSNALARRLNRIWDEAYSETGLSAPHAYLLRLVCADPELTQKAVAAKLYLEKSTVTRFVNALIKKKLIRRVPGIDGREQHLVPTAAGKKLGIKLEAIGQALFEQLSEITGKKKIINLVKEMRMMTSKFG